MRRTHFDVLNRPIRFYDGFMRRYTYSVAGLVDSVIPGGAGLAWTPRQYVYNAARGTLSGIRLGVPT